MNFARSFWLFFLGRESALVCSLVNAILLARTLGAQGYGTYSLVVTTAHLLTQASCLGFNYSNAHMAAKAPASSRRLMVVSFLPLGLVLLPLLITAWMAPTAWDWLFGDLDPGQRRSIWTGTGLLVVAANLASVLVGLEAFGLMSIVSALGPMGMMLTNLAGLILERMTLEWAVRSWVAWNSIVLLVTLALLIPKGSGRWLPDRMLISSSVKVGLRALVTTILSFSCHRGLLVLIDRVLGRVAVGHYAVMMPIAEGLNHVPAALGGVIFADASAREGGRTRVVRLIRIYGIAGGCAAVGIGLSSPILMPLLFGDRYGGDLLPLWILLAGNFIMGFWTLCSSDQAGKHGYPPSLILLEAFGMCWTLGLGGWAMTQWGLRGAAGVHAAAMLLMAVSMVIVFLKDTRGGVTPKDLVPRPSELHGLIQRMWRRG
jgi:O-antigen/teichoic acid export membrane protein